jgi:hypothetical protein
MLMGTTKDDWSIVLEAFDAVRPRSGEPSHNDRKFMEALHYFTVHGIIFDSTVVRAHVAAAAQGGQQNLPQD